MWGADLSDAGLSGADPRGDTEFGLSRTNSTDAIVTGADFTGVIWGDTTRPDGTSSNDDLGSCDI